MIVCIRTLVWHQRVAIVPAFAGVNVNEMRCLARFMAALQSLARYLYIYTYR
jgi:hypothetical protein